MSGVNNCLSLKRVFMPLLEISFLAKFTHPEEEKNIPRYVYCLTYPIIVLLYFISGHDVGYILNILTKMIFGGWAGVNIVYFRLFGDI
jgi:hypothetical protein